jgi:hypothetical protein
LELGLSQHPLPTPKPGKLRVRLAFGAEADLDLFVTDPTHESVYFANSPSRSGGELHSDLRCGSEAPRIEVVSFERAPPGRYRVGVDFPERCDALQSPVALVVSVETQLGRKLHRQSIRPRIFEPIVLEFDIP